METGDNLSLVFSTEGRVAECRIGDVRLPMIETGGFFAADCAASMQETNLAPNPGFEQGTEGWSLDPTQQLDTAVAHSGRASVRLHVPGPEAGGSNVGVRVPVKGGRQYRVGVWMRKQDCRVCAAYVSQYNAAGELTGGAAQIGLGSPAADDRWFFLSKTIETALDAETLLLRADIYRSTGTAWVDDFTVVELTVGRFEPVIGSLRREGESLQFRADLSGMQLLQRATFTPKEELIQVDGEIEDTSGRDRAIAVAFRLPFDAQGWIWSHDIEERAAISHPAEYSRTYRCESGEGRCSIYPFAALSSERAGLSLALPLSAGPRVFLLGYDNVDKFAFVNFYLGVSKETAHFPRRASFHFVIYRHDPKWTMRSAAVRYYEFFPESFEKRSAYEGYLNYANLEQADGKTRRLVSGGSAAEDASDFGEGFRFLTHLHGCYHFQMYFTEDTSKPKDEDVRAFLSGLVEKERSRPRQYCPTEELLKKIVVDADGRIRYIGDTRYWPPRQGYNRGNDKPGWGLNFRVNEDPAVSDYLANQHREIMAQWRRSPEWRPWEACVTADAICGYVGNTRGLNYRREHFRSVTFPLTFGRDSRKAAISNGIWEFHRQVWRPLTEKYEVLTYGNANTYEWSFILPFVDIPMIESNFDRDNPARCERFMRTMGRHKVWRTCYVARPGAARRDGAVAQFHRGLAYGIFPSVYALFGELDLRRGLYRKYIPALEHLAAAGWSPIPYACTSDPAIPVERFGDFRAGSLHFTLRNYGDEAKRVRISFDADGLGVPADEVGSLRAKEMLTGRLIGLIQAPTGLAADVTVAPDDSLGLRVDTPNGFARYALTQADAGFRRIERMFRSDLTESDRAELARGRKMAADALRSFEAAEDKQKACAAMENLQQLLRNLAPEIDAEATVDWAKVCFRVKTELAEGTAALLGADVRLARETEGAPGQRSTLKLGLHNGGEAALSDIRLSVLSPWPEAARRAQVAGAPTRLAPGASGDCEVVLLIPNAPARSLLPFVVEARGRAHGSPFTLAALVDVIVPKN